MKLKTLQWNIGAARLRDEAADPASATYEQEDLLYVAELIKKYSPDLVTLQETHSDARENQVTRLSELTGLYGIAHAEYAESHLGSGKKLGQGILSRFPISDSNFTLFQNPRYELITTDGERWVSHDKGVLGVLIELSNGQKLELKTLHMIPFRKFGVNPLHEASAELRQDMARKLVSKHTPYLVQGDFNYNEESLRPFLPEIFREGTEEAEISEPTTPRGRRYDRVLFRGMHLTKLEVIEGARTDHYPVYCEFEC